jgi:hypothetical protein
MSDPLPNPRPCRASADPAPISVLSALSAFTPGMPPANASRG